MTAIRTMRKIDRLAVARIIGSRSEDEALEFVKDPLNEDVIKQLAFKWLVTMQESAYRNGTRELERMVSNRGRVPKFSPEHTPEKHTHDVVSILQAPTAHPPRAWKTLQNADGPDLVKALMASGVPRKALNVAPKWGHYALDGVKIRSPYFEEWRTTIEGRDWIEHNPEAVSLINSRQAAFDASSDEHFEKTRERQEEFASKINLVMSDYAAHLRVQWTEELLNRTFKVNGVEVRWADATEYQHQSRITELMAKAQGTLETAAMHEKAIADIRDAGVKTLGQVS